MFITALFSVKNWKQVKYSSVREQSVVYFYSEVCSNAKKQTTDTKQKDGWISKTLCWMKELRYEESVL